MTVPPEASQSNSSDYFEDDNSQFLEALNKLELPGDIPFPRTDGDLGDGNESGGEDSEQEEELEPPPPAQPSRKRPYVSDDETDSERVASLAAAPNVASQDDDIYGPSRFGGFGEYMSRKRAKLQIQNEDITRGEVKSDIFKDLSIYINGYTQPSIQELRRLIVNHGGVFQPYLDKKSLVTHIITCSLTPAKIREFKNMKVVRPEWLVESAEAGTLLPWRNYIYIHNKQLEPLQVTRAKQRTILDSHLAASDSAKPTAMIKSATAPITPSRAENSARANGPSSPQSVHPARSPTSPSAASLIDNPYISDPKNLDDAVRVSGYASFKSNPLAERVMANPEWRQAHTSASTDFVEGYYKNSRLHHLSTWKAELKNLVIEAQERAESIAALGNDGVSVGKVDSEIGSDTGIQRRELVKKPSKGKQKAADDLERVIMHCDFDCFFVSAGLVSRPHLKGKPVVVCHSQGGQGGALSTSEIASSSYKAREFGVKNGMSLQQARKLCPNIITIPYEFERYKQISLQCYTILMSHADDLQAVSVDEALIDVSSTVTQLRSRPGHDDLSVDPAKDFAEMIRAQIRKATGCEVSIGISHNILLARLATRRAKPAGSYHLTAAEVQEFLDPLDISDLHGFGWSTKQKAQEKLSVTKLGELAKKSKSVLCDALGKGTGETLYHALRGIDDKKLESDKPRKSVSCDINYGIRFANNDQAEAFIYQMAAEVKKRLDAIDMVGKSVTLKIMKRDPSAPVEPPKFMGHGACELFNKQMPLPISNGRGTSDDQVIGEYVWRMLKSFKFDPRELRGIGIQVQKLEPVSGAANVALGQAKLEFKPAVSPKKAGPSNFKAPEIRVQSPSQHHEDIVMKEIDKAYNAPPNASTTYDLPSFSQVDMSVFEALPRDVREELENEYKRRSASPSVGEALADQLPKAGPSRPSVPPRIFPQRLGDKRPNFKRISRQLAPRNRLSILPLKVLPFGLKPKKPSSVKITDKKLRDFGIDPEVFRALPIKVQREQLIMARIIKEKGSIPEPPKKKIVLKPRPPNKLPPHLVWRAPPPRAKFKQPPFLRQQGKEKKDKLYFTETDDIQRVLETWMTTYHRWSPKEKDMEFLAKYLLQCVDGAKFTDVAVERAIAVMKWWLILLRRFFPHCELEEEGEPDGSQTDWVGEAWWKGFRDLKTRMDVVAKKRFGGCLSLR